MKFREPIGCGSEYAHKKTGSRQKEMCEECVKKQFKNRKFSNNEIVNKALHNISESINRIINAYARVTQTAAQCLAGLTPVERPSRDAVLTMSQFIPPK